MLKVGDRVRNTEVYYSDLAKEGTIEGVYPNYYSVAFDNYETLCCTDEDIELVKEKKQVEIPKVYKALIKTKEGKLVSLWAGVGGGTELTYKEGEITYAPEDSMGIFAGGLGEANDNVETNWRAKKDRGIAVIHEAVPLGNQLPNGGGLFENHDRYPAILLGKEVWGREPKEEWIDITEKCADRIDYKIEVASKDFLGSMSTFRVFKRVPK